MSNDDILVVVIVVLVACFNFSISIMGRKLTFLHRWQMNLHEQSWLRMFHTTKAMLCHVGVM